MLCSMTVTTDESRKYTIMGLAERVARKIREAGFEAVAEEFLERARNVLTGNQLLKVIGEYVSLEGFNVDSFRSEGDFIKVEQEHVHRALDEERHIANMEIARERKGKTVKCEKKLTFNLRTHEFLIYLNDEVIITGTDMDEILADFNSLPLDIK